MPNTDGATLAALAALNGGAAGNLSAGTTGADLSNFQRTVSANDPWNMAYAPIASAKLNTATWTPNQALAGNLGQAALAAVLKTLGNRDEANQLYSVAQVLPQLYKDPTSVDTPEGVDPAAFNALKFSAIGRQATTEDLIRRTLGEKGVTLNPDGSAMVTPGAADALSELYDAQQGKRGKQPLNTETMSPDFKQALDEAGGDVVLARQLMKQTMASQPTLNGLSNAVSMVGELEKLKTKPQTFNSPNVPDYLNGVGNSLAAILDPGSNSATFNSAVIPITDSLLRALTQVGRGSQYTQSQIKDDLSNAWAKGPDALAARIKNYQDDLISASAQRANDLVANGYTRANPILDTVNSLAANGPGSLLSSSSPTSSGVDPALLKQEASALSAQGMTPAQIAQTLRAKYSGSDSSAGEW